MKRNLILEEDDLVMVVKQDVVKQIDDCRGELTRTEFVNYLIQCQLQQMQENNPYVTRKDFQDFSKKMAELVHGFMDCMVSHGVNEWSKDESGVLAELAGQLDSITESGLEKPEHR